MSLLIRKVGVFTSLQGGRVFGGQRYGVAPAGAMDQTAARIANLLLDNDESVLTLESHFPGPELEFDAECTFSLAGADFGARLDDEPIANWSVHRARPSSVLRFTEKAFGNRAYIAVGGGFESASTESGDIQRTRRVAAGERLTSKGRNAEPSVMHGSVSRRMLPAYSAFPTVRVLEGPEYSLLGEEERRTLLAGVFTLGNASNRMGFFLEGPVIPYDSQRELVSAAVTFGTIQLPPNGRPIILMADHQATGGYPRIAQIISADLPLAAQLGPGDRIAFHMVEMDTAHRAMLRFTHDLRWLRTGVGFGRYW